MNRTHLAQTETMIDAGKYRMSRARRAILKLFTEHPMKHFTAVEIHTHLEQTRAPAGLATVYRNLDLLTKLGFLILNRFGQGRKEYEYNPETVLSDPSRHHIICEECGSVIDLENLLPEEIFQLKKFIDKIRNRLHFTVRYSDNRYIGICPDCFSG